MVITLFNTLNEEDKNSAIEKLIHSSTPNQDFFVMMLLSATMASLGFLLNSVTVIIGSMLIAPLLFPILSLALGITMSDGKLMARSFYTALKATLIAIIASTVVALFTLGNESIITSPLIASMMPSLPYIAVAVVAGFAAAFSFVKPHMNETFPGIVISVALIPPLAAIGIGIANFDWLIISHAFLLFLINTIGIVFASMINFSLMNFYVKRKVAQKTIKEAQAIQEEQKQKAVDEQAKKVKK